MDGRLADGPLGRHSARVSDRHPRLNDLAQPHQAQVDVRLLDDHLGTLDLKVNAQGQRAVEMLHLAGERVADASRARTDDRQVKVHLRLRRYKQV